MNREKFEALPDIAEMFLNNDELKWDEDLKRYKNHRVFQDAETGFINGAYCAFCEQEKIIQMQECGVKAILEIIDSIVPYEYDLDTMSKINKIKELLK